MRVRRPTRNGREGRKEIKGKGEGIWRNGGMWAEGGGGGRGRREGREGEGRSFSITTNKDKYIACDADRVQCDHVCCMPYTSKYDVRVFRSCCSFTFFLFAVQLTVSPIAVRFAPCHHGKPFVARKSRVARRCINRSAGLIPSKLQSMLLTTLGSFELSLHEGAHRHSKHE